MMALSSLPMRFTNCWLWLQRALSKRERTLESLEVFSAGKPGCIGQGCRRRMAVKRKDAALVGARRFFVDRHRRSELARMVGYCGRGDRASHRTAYPGERGLERRLQR